ncbi:hypothetical protein [Nitrospira moscoviensis]|uniref:Uncharacterized protein n=1 Tax=Nitrospira moscoviensis TaxID=42253 RepID=A0A0K2GGG7_NITMO|nr:hypothetical protein [Nitrospira moscoviensis]ALA60058.1 hypothetical protein NITMOv2_3666 [Nitrospira moscoviensis]
MTCTRCNGLMVADDLIDLQESYLPMWMRGWRCIACGNIVDPLIQRHRTGQRAGALDAVHAGQVFATWPRPAKAA